MSNLSPSSREEEDLIARSTKKVEFDEGSEQPMAEKSSPATSPSTSPKGKASYKDMVMASEGFEGNQEDMVRAITEELFPAIQDSDEESPNPEAFNPYPEVQISYEEYENWCKPWKNTLIVKLLGRKLSLRFLSARLQSLWAIRGQVKVADLNDEFFTVRFSDPEDYNHTLFEGPWLITDHYLLVQRWRPRFKPYQDSIKKIAIWVRIPNLPMELYNPHFLWREADPNSENFKDPDNQGVSILPEGERVDCDSKVPLDTKGTSSSPQVSCFGPWMLAKKPQRRATKPGFNGAMKDGGIAGSKTNGSRFDILQMDTSENVEPTGYTLPSNNEMNSTDKTEQSSQQLQHNIVRVRDPKGGKNPQPNRLNKPKQLATVSKQGKNKSQEIVNTAHKVIIPENIVKTSSKEISNNVPTSILPVRNKPILPRTQEQKEADHEFALQLIKKWGSPQELQFYKSIQADPVMHQDPLTTCLEPEPEPPDKEFSTSHMIIDENSIEPNHVVMNSNISQEGGRTI
ncbi:hypothetical protein SESBI_42905 [Sesbania bispinosa]|nr:hypothetical protein SESBI_42905 [Sesbania bispinosa]